MNIYKILSYVLKAPLVGLMIVSLGASIYVAYAKLYDINWITPIILGLILVAYFVGVYFAYLSHKQENKFTTA